MVSHRQMQLGLACSICEKNQASMGMSGRRAILFHHTTLFKIVEIMVKHK